MAGPNGSDGRRKKLPRLPEAGKVISRPPATSPQRRNGGPTLLSRELISLFERFLAVQPNRKKVCKELGVSQAAFYDWWTRGRQEDCHPLHREFALAIERAKVKWERERLEVIVRAAEDRELTTTSVETSTGDGKTRTRAWTKKKQVRGDYRAAQWLLERRLPKTYGRKDKVELSGNVSLAAILTALRTDLSEEERKGIHIPEIESQPA